MENKLEYNTERSKLAMPEYGRNVLKMVEQLKAIEDREKRSQQAKAVIKVMEILNPQVHTQEDFEHKLWDQLYMIAGYDLDVDSPYPMPEAGEFEKAPVVLPMKDSKIKAAHYGRNIEKIIDLLCNEPESETKDEMIRLLAVYMRKQYLIWNKDSVADETLFADIEKLSDYKIRIPEGMKLGKINDDISYNRPSLGINSDRMNGGQQRNRQFRNNNRRIKKK